MCLVKSSINLFMRTKPVNNQVTLARNLRRKQTDAERKMWRVLRGRQFENSKFRRQEPIGQYIVDFVSLERQLIIEIDGGQHNQPPEIKKMKSGRNGWKRKALKLSVFGITMCY